MSDTRVVLVKPGDLLIIGNLGSLPAEALDLASGCLAGLKDSLGLAGIVLFEGDIDLAVVAESQAGGQVAQSHPDPDLLTQRDG